MNRRQFLYSSALTVAGASLLSRLSFAANGKIGTLTPAEFEKANQDGAAAVGAVKATSAPLSKADEALMMQVAMGGMMQLEVSGVAAAKTNDDDVRIFAKGEIEEQKGLKKKLAEVAKMKNMTLPSEPDDKTKKMVAMLNGLSGAELNNAYMQQSGVDGHELLLKTMTKVEAEASDPALKGIATAALPLIKTHLAAAKAELSDGGAKKSA